MKGLLGAARIRLGMAVWASVNCVASAAAQRDSSSATAPVRATAGRYRNRLLGVYDSRTGEPIAGVEVADLSSGTKSVTGENGLLSLVYLPDGGSVVRLRKLGYHPHTLFVRISPTDTSPLTMLLEPEPPTLPLVQTVAAGEKYLSPSLRGFEERRRSGNGGEFIDDSTLRSLEGEPMSNVLRRLGGAMIDHGHLSSTRVAVAGPVLLAIGGKPCYARIYLDGVLIFSPEMIADPPDLEHDYVDQYAGIEFYPSAATLPMWITPSNSGCGTLLLWTRER